MELTQSEHRYRQVKSGMHQSQHGEDKWLDLYFKGKQKGFFVEVGAYNGVVLSNSYYFEVMRQWTGLLIEPDAANAASCRANRPNSKTYECAAIGSAEISEVSFFKVSGGEVYSTVNLIDTHALRLQNYGLTAVETKVSAKTLDQILGETKPKAIDFVSIDVEEGELDVLMGFDIERWKPKIVMIESNSSTRDPLIQKYFVERGYAYFHSIAVNDFYRPAIGGAIFARSIDRFRYANSPRLRGQNSLPTVARQLLDRYLLWRFKR